MRGMRRQAGDAIELKAVESKRIANEIDEFLANGGRIQEIESGVYGEERVTRTENQKRTAAFI